MLSVSASGRSCWLRARAARPRAELGVRLVRVAFGGRDVDGDRDALRQLLDDSSEGGGELAGPVDDERVPGRLLNARREQCVVGAVEVLPSLQELGEDLREALLLLRGVAGALDGAGERLGVVASASQLSHQSMQGV